MSPAIMNRLTAIAQDLLGLRLSTAQLRAFQSYADELIAWNNRFNLTAITEPEAVEIQHFADSLTCLLVLPSPPTGLRIVDVGAGAGFPGLPLKIVFPSLSLTLIESTGKKARFLHHVVTKLGLDGVNIVNERAEAAGQSAAHREAYDWALARAVASMSSLVEYLLPLCKIGGHCLAHKGESAHQEVAEAQNAIDLLGGQIVQLTPVELPTVVETRYLIDIEKKAATPPKYPRRPGMPTKRPL